MHRGGRLLGRQAAAGSGHRTHLLGPLAPTATAATRAVILPETVDSRGAARGYAKGKGRGMPEQPKKEYKNDEYLDEVLKAYGIPVPTWDDLPDWVWQAEVRLRNKGKQPLTPFSRLFHKKLNRERIKAVNDDRTWGIIKGKWKLGCEE